MKRNAASPLRGRWRRMLGLTWLDDDDTIVPNAAKVQSPAPALDESATGVSFTWPRDTDLTREQLEIAMRHEAAAASVSQPDAGPLPVGETASVAPCPPMIQTGEKVSVSTESDTGVSMTAADWIARARPGDTLVLGGIVGTRDVDGSTVVWSDGPAMYGHGEMPGAAMRDYAECMVDVRDIQRRYGDAFDTKAQIREQQRHAGRGDAGDGHPGEPPDYDVWSR